MSKRPLCQAAVLLVVLLVCLNTFLPDLFRQEDIPAMDGETVTISGRIYARQDKEDKTCYYLKDIIFIESNETSEQFHGKCIVYCKAKETGSIGNYIQLTGTISFFEEATNPGQFNAKSYYGGLGIDFSIFQATIQNTNNQKDTIKEALYSFRTLIHNKLNKLAGEHSSILQAMLLGEKSQMDSEIKELYQKSGISHILVISGLHFSLLGMTLYKLLRKTGAHFFAAGITSVLVLFLYGIMTGFGVSAIRAFIMFFVGVGADITGRSYDFPTSLAIAVIWLVLSNPLVLYQTGFLLSVGAILGIIIFVPVIEELYTGSKKMGTLTSGLSSGIAIQLMTFPILLYSFCEFSPYSIFLNCLILPLVPVVILGAIVAVLVSFILPGLAGILMLPSVWVLELYEFLCRCVEKIPASVIVTGQPPMYRIVIYYVIMLGMAAGIWYLKKRDADREKIFLWKNKRMCGFAVAGLTLAMAVLLTFSKDTDGMEIAMLDVGQGQSIYIRCGNEDVLYDGGSTDVSDVGKYRIGPFLKAKGVDSLELVIVSHMDADHYNGILQILEEELVEVKCLMLPLLNEPDEAYIELVELAETKGVTIQQVEKNDYFQIGDAKFHVLHPYIGYQTDSKNDTSIVMSMVYGDFSMLFTGDVEEAGEEAMIRAGGLPDVDVLQVAHHGSDSSSTQEFIDKVSPEVAWISCGKDNYYGHPSKNVVERLENEGCQVFRTDEQGCVTMEIGKEWMLYGYER